MKAIYQNARPGCKAASESHNSLAPPNTSKPSAGHLPGGADSIIKRLLVVGILALSLSAFAADPTATDMGRFIKFAGKQAVTSPVEDDDIAYVRKSAIISFESTKQLVNITLTTGYLAFAFETKEAARAFLAQMAAFCVKDQ